MTLPNASPGRRRRVVLVAPPFSGHLHPTIGVARLLQPVAEVCLLSTPQGVQAARQAGVPAQVVLGHAEDRVWAIAEPGYAVKGNPVGLFRQLRANLALMSDLKREVEAHYRALAPDLVIADFAVPVAGWAAQQAGIPWWTTLRAPCVLETPDGPPAYFGGQTPATGRLGQGLQAGMRQATRAFKHLAGSVFRRELRALGIETLYRADGSEVAFSPDWILGLWMDELEFPCTYPAAFSMVGPIPFTPATAHPAPVFTPGRPHVLITVGTHLPQVKARMAEAVRTMARALPDVVFHFTHGQARADFARVEANVHEYAFISYAEHLARYDLVVHHGGAGVALQTLAQGTPALVYPLDFDQFDNAARLEAAGAARRVRSLRELAPAVRVALASAPLRTRCAELAQAMTRYQPEAEILRRLLALPS